MSPTISVSVFCLLLLLDTNMAARQIPSSAPSTIVRPLLSEAHRDYATLNPQFSHKKRVFRVRDVKGCLPKGSKHSSAPSRYVNYHTLDNPSCSSYRPSKRP
ncbi:hypothetical protein I3843_14G087900 [Carya illinoinensis]|uniref:Uncharacterized protein n=1 Tax=Carya illinoinensis TaxID=32201 RepID=A0A8T1NI63_CARIL|nr:hypothetical protein I3760_14G088200 [Carya illinoinensis]KAG6629461.1 hypothetical protein CIPAW_14G086500 [Carya illinoinensis]KAG6678609.1 hypothetical protein I3842_14G088800 [Carya illinoinensis]KAG7947321.1 hypothetical protein I3843_14G087900 [Carya illinoinensis]